MSGGAAAVVTVACPAGVRAGQTVRIPHEGGTYFDVVVPAGVGPGQQFQATLPTGRQLQLGPTDDFGGEEEEEDEQLLARGAAAGTVRQCARRRVAAAATAATSAPPAARHCVCADGLTPHPADAARCAAQRVELEGLRAAWWLGRLAESARGKAAQVQAATTPPRRRPPPPAAAAAAASACRSFAACDRERAARCHLTFARRSAPTGTPRRCAGRWAARSPACSPSSSAW